MGETNHSPAALHLLLESVANCFTLDTAKALVSLRQELARKTMETLGEKASTGQLTPAEAEEYDALIETSDFVATLQLKAKRQLAAHKTA